MVLPQGECFDILKNRLKCVSYAYNLYSTGLTVNDVEEPDFEAINVIFKRRISSGTME